MSARRGGTGISVGEWYNGSRDEGRVTRWPRAERASSLIGLAIDLSLTHSLSFVAAGRSINLWKMYNASRSRTAIELLPARLNARTTPMAFFFFTLLFISARNHSVYEDFRTSRFLVAYLDDRESVGGNGTAA